MSAGRALLETPIGREVEAARLAQLIDDTAAGAKRAVILLGAPGIGKTTLLRWARDRADASGCISASVRVPAAAGLPPRYPLGQLLEAILTATIERGSPAPERLQRVVATLMGARSSDSYAVAAPQIADALEEVGGRGPLAIFLDDYHWAPSDGIELLIAVLRVLETQVCFVASSRLHGLGEEAVNALPEPSADLWVEHMEIRGLEPQAVATLAGSLLGGEVLPSLADALYTRTFGNPLFLTETIQTWRSEGALITTGGYWGLDHDAAPAHARSLREMITTRLARMDEETAAIVRALAAIGRDADFEELSAVSAVGPERLIAVLESLHQQRLLVLEANPNPRYRLAHPLYAASLLDEEGTPQRALLHGKILEELRRRRGRVSAAELAHHAVRALTRPPDLRQILTAAAEEAEAAGSSEEAAVWYGHLAEEADDPRELVRALRGQAIAGTQNDPQRAIDLFVYALELETDPAARARLLLGRARAHRVAGSPESAMRDLHDALPLAAPDEVFDIRHAIGAFHGMLGRLDEAEAVFLALTDESQGTPDHPKAIGHLGMVALVRGRLVDGTVLMEQALSSGSDDAYATYLRGNLAWLVSIQGRWEEGESLVERVFSGAVSSGDIYTECTILGIGARLASWRGDLATAFDRATRVKRLANRLGNPADQLMAADALASALMENDLWADASALLADALALDVPETEEREAVYSFSVLAEACALADDLPRARLALDHARAHLYSAPFWEIAIDRCEAQIDLACGDPRRSMSRVARWLEEPTDIALEHAHVRRVAAEALRALGDRTGAMGRAQEALDRYTSLGATRMAMRTARFLESLPAQRGRPRSTLPGQLTGRESEILRLVVLGRSNQGVADELVISVATVKKHVENIMAKAGVSRRTELVPFAISVGVLVPDELIREREAARERSAGSRVPRPSRRGPSIAPSTVRPGRAIDAEGLRSEKPGR